MNVVETVMGMPMSIDIRDTPDAAAAEAARAAFAVLHEADRRFSAYRDDSEVCAVNRGELTPSQFSAPLREVLRIADEAGHASGGAFSVRGADGALDTDGVVKGWAAANAARALEARGIRNFCLNAAGDVVLSGSPGGGALWNVGIRSVVDAGSMMAVLAVTDCGVATSAAYERGEHIVDRRTGCAAHGLQSVTVVAPDLATADVLATLVYAMGPEGIDVALAHGATGVLALTDAGELLGAGELSFAR